MKYLVLATLSMVGPAIGYSNPSEYEGLTLHGTVFDQKTHSALSADVDIFLNSDFISVYSGKTAQGKFTAELKDFGWYLISISAPGYLETTDTLWMTNEDRKSVTKTFYASPIEKGLTVTLNNLYFETGKTKLSEESFPELDKVATFFKDNPGVAFEIAGHTDSNGPEAYNLWLSEGRAQAVHDYLVSQGVEADRLTTRGYGKSKPIDTSQTRLGEAKNRRVEFVVLNLGLPK